LFGNLYFDKIVNERDCNHSTDEGEEDEDTTTDVKEKSDLPNAVDAADRELRLDRAHSMGERL